MSAAPCAPTCSCPDPPLGLPPCRVLAQDPAWPLPGPWSQWGTGAAEPSQPLSAHSHACQLWRALGAEQPVSRLVLAMLLAWLQERPLPIGASDSSPQPKEKTYLHSLAVSLCRLPGCRSPLPPGRSHFTWAFRCQRCLGAHRVPGPREGGPSLAWRKSPWRRLTTRPPLPLPGQGRWTTPEPGPLCKVGQWRPRRAGQGTGLAVWTWDSAPLCGRPRSGRTSGPVQAKSRGGERTPRMGFRGCRSRRNPGGCLPQPPPPCGAPPAPASPTSPGAGPHPSHSHGCLPPAPGRGSCSQPQSPPD